MRKPESDIAVCSLACALKKLYATVRPFENIRYGTQITNRHLRNI